MPLSVATHAAIGAASGIIEVTLLHPTVAWKNALQEGRPLSLAPSALYRGYVLNAGSFAPITMVQFGVNRLLESTFSAAGDGACVRLRVCLRACSRGAAGAAQRNPRTLSDGGAAFFRALRCVRVRRLRPELAAKSGRRRRGRVHLLVGVHAVRAHHHPAAGAHRGSVAAEAFATCATHM
jgi:hypothetical protein